MLKKVGKSMDLPTFSFVMNKYLIFHFVCLFLVLFHVVGKEIFAFGFIPEVALAGNYLLTISFLMLFLENWKKSSWEKIYVRILKFFSIWFGSGFLFALVTFPLAPVGALIVTYTLPQGKILNQHYYIDTPTRVGMGGGHPPCDYYLHKTVVGIFDITAQKVDICAKSIDCFAPQNIKVDETSRKLHVYLKTIQNSKFCEGDVKRDTTIVISLK